jgi:hypothetical protein
MNLEQFVKLQTECIETPFSLTEGEERERQRFLQMAVQTYDFLQAAGKRAGTFKINPDSAYFFNGRGLEKCAGVSSILEIWESWRNDYPALLERNSKLETYDMIRWISETHIFMGWPPDSALEERIQEWLDNGSFLPLPFDDRLDMMTLEFYEKLRNLRLRLKGWLHYDESRRRVVFSPEVEWQAIRAERRSTRSGSYIKPER